MYPAAGAVAAVVGATIHMVVVETVVVAGGAVGAAICIQASIPILHNMPTTPMPTLTPAGLEEEVEMGGQAAAGLRPMIHMVLDLLYQYFMTYMYIYILCNKAPANAADVKNWACGFYVLNC